MEKPKTRAIAVDAGKSGVESYYVLIMVLRMVKVEHNHGSSSGS
jgi:hypothetical protein